MRETDWRSHGLRLYSICECAHTAGTHAAFAFYYPANVLYTD